MAQELTVAAGLEGSRDLVVDALRADPLTSRIDVGDAVERLADEMLAATAPWLPQFAMDAVPLQVLTFPSRRELARRLPRLFLGLIVMGIGIAPVLDAELGVSPWDVFHQGLADLTGLSFGLVVVLVGLLVLLTWIPLKQRAGIGTIINTLTIGFIVNGMLNVIPEVESLWVRWAMLLGGLVISVLGMALYIGAGLGPGPRDGLMTAISARGYPLWIVRTVIELLALAAGFALGGDVGIGTVLFVFGIGPIGHWFLARLHLGVDGADPDPTATVGE